MNQENRAKLKEVSEVLKKFGCVDSAQFLQLIGTLEDRINQAFLNGLVVGSVGSMIVLIAIVFLGRIFK